MELQTVSAKQALQLVNRFNEEKAIYPQFGDNRRNMYEVSDAIQELAKAVACLISQDNIVQDGEGYTLKGDTLATRKELGQLGNQVAFADEPSLGLGTAFLVHQNFVLTAGHCVCKRGEEEVDPNKVQNTRLVFGFKMETKTKWNPQISTNNVHSFTVAYFSNKGRDGDWALLRLENSIHHIKILPTNFIDIVTGDPNVYMLGHPSGLPLKLAEEGKVQILPTAEKERFQAKITAFAGNSGSPVFNAVTNQVVGILVAGNDDFSGLPASDHIVSPSETSWRGYEKCQRTSALPDDVVCEITPEEVGNRTQADKLHNQAVEKALEGKQEEAFREFIDSGDLGLHFSYLNAIVLNKGKVSLETARQYSEQFFNYLQSSEASAAGIKVGEDSKVYIIAGEGSLALAQGSTFRGDSRGMITAKDGGKTYGQEVTVYEKGRLQAAAGFKGTANANKAEVHKGGTLVVIANDDKKTEEAMRRANRDFWDD